MPRVMPAAFHLSPLVHSAPCRLKCSDVAGRVHISATTEGENKPVRLKSAKLLRIPLRVRSERWKNFGVQWNSPTRSRSRLAPTDRQNLFVEVKIINRLKPACGVR